MIDIQTTKENYSSSFEKRDNSVARSIKLVVITTGRRRTVGVALSFRNLYNQCFKRN